MTENTRSPTGIAMLNANAGIIEQAAQAMCEHYQCGFDDLTLYRTNDFPNQILVKKRPGLAYLIRYIFEDENVRVVAEPIYLEPEA